MRSENLENTPEQEGSDLLEELANEGEQAVEEGQRGGENGSVDYNKTRPLQSEIPESPGKWSAEGKEDMDPEELKRFSLMRNTNKEFARFCAGKMGVELVNCGRRFEARKAAEDAADESKAA